MSDDEERDIVAPLIPRNSTIEDGDRLASRRSLIDAAMSYDYHSDICCAAEAGSCSFNGAVANLVVTAVGAGMLALPKAAASVGLLLAFALIVTVSFLTFFSSFVIVRYCAREKAESYGALVKSTFGAAGARVLQGAIIIHVFGVMVVYLIIISDMLVGSPPTWSGLLPYVLNEYSGPWWLTRWVVAAILVVTTVAPMLISRDLSVVSRFSRFSVGLLLLLAATLVCLAGTAVVQGKAADIKVLPDLETMGGGTVLGMISSVLTVLAVSALAFTIAFNLVPVHNSLEDNRTSTMLRVTRYAIGLSALLYSSIAVAGYTLFGEETDGDVLKNLTVPFVTQLVGRRAAVALITFIVVCNTGNLLVNFVLKVWAVRDAGCELVIGKSSRDLPQHTYYLLTAALVLAAYGTFTVIPSVWFLVGLVGSTACVTFSYAFPGLILMRKSHKKSEKVMGGGAVVLAVVMAAVAIYNALTGNAAV